MKNIKAHLSINAFKDFFSETLPHYDAVVIGEDKNIYLAGIVGIVQEVTEGLTPLYIGRTALQLAKIKSKIMKAEINAFWIFDSKHNLTDDEPRGEQLVFDWEMKDDQLLVKSSYSLVGKVRHQGFQS